jgi:hypothetical protein
VNAALHPPLAWPRLLVEGVRAFKAIEGFFSDHAVCGIPLDLPLRFIVLGGAYLWLRPRLGPRRAATLCGALLLLKEVFDCFAVLDLRHPRPPDWGDAADVLSGLAGLVAAELIVRWRDCRAHDKSL